MNDESKKPDDPLMDQMLERLLDGQSIEVTGNNKANQVVSQLQQLMHSFIPHEHEFNSQDLLETKWGDMQVQKVLGEGGMGVVYLAHDAVLNRSVALKVLNGFALNYMDAESFVNEAKLMAQVRHPHIMAVFGAAIHDDIAGYWGELLKGQTVDEYLAKKGRLNDRELSDLSIQLAEAVRAIHRKGLVHGDIKSNNVVIEAGRGAVLMDFGTSFDLNDVASAWFRPSTPLAMAPEQFKGEKQSQASDVFSLGVLFHLMVTGEYPYAGKTFEALKAAVLADNRRPFNNPHHHKAYERLINCMLCPAPEDSPSINEVLVELRHIRQLPLQQAKNRLFTIAALALVVITTASLYFAYTIKQSEIKLTEANKESEQVNQVLEEILRSPSTNSGGENVLMLDVIKQASNKLKSNQDLSLTAKGRILYALGYTLNTLNQTEDAENLFLSIIGTKGNSPAVIKSTLIQLGMQSVNKRNFAQAEIYVKQAKEIPQFETDWLISEARLYGLSANLLQKQQKYNESLELCDKTLKIWEQIPDHRDKTHVLILKAKNHMFLSDFKAAEKVFEQGYEHSMKIDGEKNINTIITQMGRAAMMSELGNYESAQMIYEKITPIAREFLGNDNIFVYSIRSNHTDLLTKSGELEKALVLQEALLAEGTSSGGNAMALAELKRNIATGYVKLNRFSAAETLYIENIRELIELTSVRHYQVLATELGLACLYNQTKRPALAIEIIERILPLSLDELGVNHDYTMTMNAELAWSYFLLGETKTSMQMMKKAVQSYQNKFGSDDEKTLASAARLETIKDTAKLKK